MTTAQFVAYIIFMILSLPIIYIRPHKLKAFFHGSAAIVGTFLLVMLIWSLATMGEGGFGDTISNPGTSGSGWNVAFGIVSTIGAIAAGILNQNDYARFSTRPRDAILGQMVGIPVYAVACAVIGIIVTSATQNRYGEALWSLPNLLEAIMDHGGSRSRAAAFFGGVALIVSQLGVNIPGNALSGGTFLFLYPRGMSHTNCRGRLRYGGHLPQIYQCATRSVSDGAGLHGLQPVEAGQHRDDLFGCPEQLFRVPGTHDRLHGLVVSGGYAA